MRSAWVKNIPLKSSLAKDLLYIPKWLKYTLKEGIGSPKKVSGKEVRDYYEKAHVQKIFELPSRQVFVVKINSMLWFEATRKDFNKLLEKKSIDAREKYKEITG